MTTQSAEALIQTQGENDMNKMNKLTRNIATALLAATLAMPLLANARNDHASNNGNNSNSAVSFGGTPGTSRGLLSVNRHVYYIGDTIQVRVVYPRSLTAVWNGSAEGHVVIYIPQGQAISAPLPAQTADTPVSVLDLTELDTSVLAAGDYQLALVLTVPGGNPLDVNTWYNGFRGLLSIERLRFSAGTTSSDADGDGEFDDDADGDGFVEDEAIETETADNADDDEDDDATATTGTTTTPAT
jgi:hypothetical protein